MWGIIFNSLHSCLIQHIAPSPENIMNCHYNYFFVQIKQTSYKHLGGGGFCYFWTDSAYFPLFSVCVLN